MKIQFNVSPGNGRRVENGRAIYPNSKIFEAGDYPDKSFSMTPEEIRAAALSFQPCSGNIEHTAFLKGRACHLSRVWADEDGGALRGELSLPLALDDLMLDEERKLSAEWDRQSKTLTGIALTVTPRVLDAALMSADITDVPTESALAEKLLFAMTRHNTPEGQMAMQDLHDSAARAGAVCDRKNVNMASQKVNMASEHEATAIQKIHNVAADHGAKCKSGDKPSYYSKGTTMFDKLKALFKTAGVPDADIDAHLTDAVAEFSAAPGMTEAEKARFTALEADNARLKAAGVKADAELFASAQVASGRALPYEKDLLIAQFCQAAEDDAKAPATVKFTAMVDNKPVEKTGGRLDALKAREAMRPASGLMEEMVRHGRQLSQSDVHALFSRNSPDETPEEKTERLAKAIEAERKAQGLAKA